MMYMTIFVPTLVLYVVSQCAVKIASFNGEYWLLSYTFTYCDLPLTIVCVCVWFARSLVILYTVSTQQNREAHRALLELLLFLTALTSTPWTA